MVPTKEIDMYASLPIQVFRMVHVADSDVVLMGVLILVELWRRKVLVAFARSIVFLWRLSAPLVLALLLSFLFFVREIASQRSCFVVIPPLNLPLARMLAPSRYA